jgi:hypothetical protein
MRTYGRIPVPATLTSPASLMWVQVNPDANGFNDPIWITTLCQVAKLNLGESPFYANYGLPAKPSVVQQLFPDLYVAAIQQQFAPYFSSLVLAKVPSSTPTYRFALTTNQGAKITGTIAT